MNVYVCVQVSGFHREIEKKNEKYNGNLMNPKMEILKNVGDGFFVVHSILNQIQTHEYILFIHVKRASV